MRTYPGLLTNAVRSALRSKHDLMLENLALRQQLAVLTRQRARTRTQPADRLFWSWLSRYWPGWRSTLVIVQPETVVRWHRTAWRGYWTWKSRARHPGQPRISKELQGLIARIATGNPRWGAVRIQGELLALGYEVSAETVRCYRRRALRPPPSQSWRTFLAGTSPWSLDCSKAVRRSAPVVAIGSPWCFGMGACARPSVGGGEAGSCRGIPMQHAVAQILCVHDIACLLSNRGTGGDW